MKKKRNGAKERIEKKMKKKEIAEILTHPCTLK